MSRIYKEDSYMNTNRNIQHSYSPLSYKNPQRGNYAKEIPKNNYQKKLATPMRKVSITHHTASIEFKNQGDNRERPSHVDFRANVKGLKSQNMSRDPYYSGVKANTFISDAPHGRQTVSKFGNPADGMSKFENHLNFF